MPFRLAGLALGLALLSGCVQFQPQQLYAGYEAAPAPERPRTIELAVEPVIYSDANDDTVWFQDDARCTQGGLTEDVVFDGRRAVAVTWDRGAEGCEWAGLGFGWDGWAGKDLSELIPYAAIEMQVRAREGRMFGLPIVLTFEDYSGGMGFAYTDNKYFERSFIDDAWQTVTVPLSAFDLAAPGAQALDATNVKQLMFELQQSGSVYIDAVNLVWYEPEPQEPWIVLPERADPTALPITLFDDGFINDDGWGLVTDACQSIATEPAAGRGRRAPPALGRAARRLLRRYDGGELGPVVPHRRDVDRRPRRDPVRRPARVRHVRRSSPSASASKTTAASFRRSSSTPATPTPARSRRTGRRSRFRLASCAAEAASWRPLRRRSATSPRPPSLLQEPAPTSAPSSSSCSSWTRPARF